MERQPGTRAEPAVQHPYVQNQAILEPIFPYRASKCKQTQKQSIKTVSGPTFLPFLSHNCQFFFWVKL